MRILTATMETQVKAHMPDELRIVLAGAALLAVLTSLPYLVGLGLRDHSTAFDGVIAFEQDTNSYLAYIRQASRGHFLFHNPFTPEPHGDVLFNLEWLAGGWLAALPGSSPEIAYHSLRILAIFGLFVAIYKLSAEFFATALMRRFMLIALVTGGGFGWLLLVPGVASYLPRRTFLDTYAGLHPFFWMFLSPHFALGQVCATLTLLSCIRAEVSGSTRGSIRTGILVMLTGAVRPFDMLVLLTAFGLYFWVSVIGERQRGDVLLRRAIPLLVPLPVLGYYYWLFHFHPVYRWWNIQNVVVPPGPLSLALSLGLLAPLLLLSLTNLRDFVEKRSHVVLIACAVIASVGVVYSYPLLTFTLQAVTTLVIPAAFLASRRFEEPFLALAHRRGGMKLLAAFLFLNALTSAALFTSKIGFIAQGGARTSRDLVAAYRWFDSHAGARDVIMAALDSGNRIPRYAQATTFYGYGFSSVDAPAKSRMVREFYSDAKDDDYRLGLVRRFGIRYVFYGDAERALGRWDPKRAPWLVEAFRNGAAAIYIVRRHSS